MNLNAPLPDTPENRQALLQAWREAKRSAHQAPVDHRGPAAVLVAANGKVGWINPVDFAPMHYVIALWLPREASTIEVGLPFDEAIKHYRIGMYGH